jgi:hypothetical protein
MFINIVKFVVNRKNKIIKTFFDNSRFIEFFRLIDLVDLDGIKMNSLLKGDKKNKLKSMLLFSDF